MKISRFFATDMRKALNQVSEELGPDAVIMSTRKSDGGIEVVAAADYDVAVDQHNSEKTLQKKRSVSVEAPEKTIANIDIEWAQEPNIVAIKNELHLVRELLQDELGELAWHDRTRRVPIEAAMLRKMVKMGFPANFASSYAKKTCDADDIETAWLQLNNILSSALPTVENNILEKGGIVTLVGPTGVGKTTTIAKLAARYVLEHGADKVALVTTDSYRVAAHEQLRSYANIMGVSMRIAQDAKNLNGILDELSDKQLILIDTAGISQRDQRLAERMSCIINSGKKAVSSECS